MIEVCPRCYSRLGAPLKSGRQVCANCGWSSDPVASKAAPARPKRSPISEILNLCWRIVQRGITYIGQMVRGWVEGAKASRPSARPTGKRLVEGLSERLSALEQAIPTAPGEGPRWMTLEDAFRYLGGDPKDSESVVGNLNGSSSIPFRRFRLLKTEAEFRSFGLEIDVARREAKKPWLRWPDET